jgi:hypothetical protein
MSLQPFTSLQPLTAGAVAPFVSCESCSWPMRLTLVAPLWESGNAETHTYECGCCRHRQSFKLPLKQYAAVVAAPKLPERSLEVFGLQAVTRYARSIA